MSGYRCNRTFSNGWPEVDGHLHVYMLPCVGCVCFVAFALCDFSGWCLIDSVVVVVVVALSLCFLYEFFLLSGFALSRSTLHMSFAFYRTTKYRKRYIFRYRRLYHFVAIRDCWSAIIVDTLFGGQLIHSYIQDINTSLTHHFWLSGYPAPSYFDLLFSYCKLLNSNQKTIPPLDSSTKWVGLGSVKSRNVVEVHVPRF